jgi:hypothetical protein
MKGYKDVSTNIKNPKKSQNSPKESHRSSSYQRSDKRLKEEKRELIKKYLDSKL